MKNIRLDKFLADMQVGTRSTVKQFMKKGLVTVNGEVVKKPETKIDPVLDRVCFNEQEIVYESTFYFLLNKPAGVVSASRDKKERTVLDLLSPDDKRPDLFPVGRLDKDTTGFLLLTNDGAMSHNMLSPARHVDKTYLAILDKEADSSTVKAFADGLDIGDERMTLPAELVLLPPDTDAASFCGNDLVKTSDIASSVCTLVTIREGRFHQIKRMFNACGQEVTALKRISMGPLILPNDLAAGSYRRLNEEELQLLSPYKSE